MKHRFLCGFLTQQNVSKLNEEICMVVNALTARLDDTEIFCLQGRFAAYAEIPFFKTKLVKVFAILVDPCELQKVLKVKALRIVFVKKDIMESRATEFAMNVRKLALNAQRAHLFPKFCLDIGRILII